MDPADVDVSLEVGDDKVSHIQTESALPHVLPSVEDNFDEDPGTASVSTGVKRKRVTTPTRTQAHSSAGTIDPLPWHLDSAYSNSLDSSPAIDKSRLTRLGTEELEGSVWSPPPTRQLHLGAMAPLEPSELPGLPPNPNPSSRVWESHRPSNLNFTIYEDPQDQESPRVSPLQEGFHTIEENKENIFLTSSDYGTSDEDEQGTRPNLSWNEASAGPRDAFGLPLNHEMSDFVRPRDTPFPERHMRRGREVLRTLWVDETQVAEEDNGRLHDNVLTDAQLREIEQIEEGFQRGRTMFRPNRPSALRENAPFQAPANFDDDVRRVLDFQQIDDPPTATAEGNEGRRSVTFAESEVEHQQHQPEQEQEQDQ
ncbi:hypothetical protein Pdw03_7810 [Penicillium digitatum]|uniref:Uncharacterized protein n=3 Tax=Penicillium digitatum TaxID=36651 RepID=K9GET9_PEND2|nr:hypothetical protein PDIP_57330 [Penicillium digitatum Pd1]EKV11058.1 hypothetical protein PDIP_57330 [Penicillium digitatum Pd1]EKV11781.1 hypothetical protein PDIG_47950 [Penicillium digitatum PHI26]QQK43909.1 hypothetical protein Pdw03_7810 [Penicillium digitatum]